MPKTPGTPAASTPSLRLFIAIELPEAVRAALRDAVAMLRAAGVDEGLRWVRPEGIHVTLKFLGATPEARVPAIVGGLRAAAGDVAPFTLQPAGFGAFHGGRNPHFTRAHPREAYHYNLRVLWVGMQGDTAALASLAERVEDAIEPLGFPREKRRFAAHLTLARVREDAPRETRIALSAALQPFLSESTRAVGVFDPARVPEFPAFRAERVALMRSTLQRGGAVYDTIETVPLAG